ncbi:MAG: lipid A biosynthesis lauroyl acyltransferase [Gemmatimonas sp.]
MPDATTDRRPMLLRIGHAIEGALLRGVWALFAALSPERASAIAGALARAVGPHVGVSRIARRNLAAAFPEMMDDELEATVRAVWDNLGRVAGEFPHLPRLDVYNDPRVTVDGAEHIDRLRDDGLPGIFFTAHIGNWELAAIAVTQRGLPLGVVYRAANNPTADELIRRGRANLPGELLPKGREGAKRALAILQSGGHLGLLPDQKMNDGIAVPFFGRPAMTAPAVAQFALKYDCPLVPIHVVREGGFRFRIVVEPPLAIRRTGDRHADVAAVTAEVNRAIERWIRERPGQWLWLHRRWPD